MTRKMEVRILVRSLAYGIILTLFFSLFAKYDYGYPISSVRNGFPFDIVTQLINISKGEYVAIKINYLGIALDLAFWSLLVFALTSTSRKIGKRKT